MLIQIPPVDFSLWPWPVQHIPLKWAKSGRSVATDEAMRDIPTSMCDQITSPVWKKISLGSLRYPIYANLGNVAMQALGGAVSWHNILYGYI